MKRPVVIVVSGLPCSGKTALGKRIAQHFSVPFISKDAFKERLFDEIGWSDRAWSKKLSLTSYKLLFYVLETQLEVARSCIIEGNFDPVVHGQTLRNLRQNSDFSVFQIHCHTQPAVLLERFRARWVSGTRHPGHADHITLPEMEVLVQQKPIPLEIESTIWNLDTTDFATLDLELEALLAALQAQL